MNQNNEWQQKGGSLSDKTACKEFGLTMAEIEMAIRAGKLKYREQSVFGNPFFRLLRREVETLVKKKHGESYLKDQLANTELKQINQKLRKLKTELAVLEARKSELACIKN